MLRKLVRNGCKRDEFRYIMSNDEILETCKTTDIQSFVSLQQASYLGHLARQTNKSQTKRLLFNDDKRTKRGRPFETLEDKVLKKTNQSKDQFYREALKKKKKGHDHQDIVDHQMSSQ